MTTLRAAVASARDCLRAAGIDDAEIEAELLLRYAIEVVEGAGQAVSRAQLYARFPDALQPPVEVIYASLVARRLAHEPNAYITGHKEFRGLEFCVTPAVLIPRPESEGLVDVVLRELTGRSLVENSEPARPTTTSERAVRRPGRIRVADIGTGSGAIAVALAKELPHAEIYATDASWEALEVAAENARRHHAERRVALRHGDLLTPLHDYVDCIVANLPYVTTDEWLSLAPELREHEPRQALDGGVDGRDLVQELLRQAPRYLRGGGFVALEIGEAQAAALGAFVEASMPAAVWRVEQDFAGKDRYFLVEIRT